MLNATCLFCKKIINKIAIEYFFSNAKDPTHRLQAKQYSVCLTHIQFYVTDNKSIKNYHCTPSLTFSVTTQLKKQMKSLSNLTLQKKVPQQIFVMKLEQSLSDCKISNDETIMSMFFPVQGNPQIQIFIILQYHLGINKNISTKNFRQLYFAFENKKKNQ